MKFIHFLALGTTLLTASLLQAHSEAFAEDASRAHIKAKHHEEGNLYIVTKGLLTLGDTYTEEATATEPEAQLKGRTGRGVGIDLGYRIGYGFAVELDFAYVHTDVKKRVEGEEEEMRAGADYYSTGLDLLYGYHLNEAYVLFGKVGWEIEHEEISKYDISGTDNGFAYAVGVEHAITEHWAFVGEYEDSLIDGPRGASLFAGASYTF
ncbi:MAG TPA: porin family protein [Campylobacteraceae bacterium]|nr:porin family protein [Campylobacteraceae bacterium]HHD84285.1 porin family protein [Campylobacteraceae bacterium]